MAVVEDNSESLCQGGFEGPAILIRGARMHNLRNVDVAIPRDKFVVITGVSGSGKSSLAFDTLFAEGQRQYLETLSAGARQYVDQIERPDVDLIEGLQPAIAIDQHSGGRGPRSTVATTTEIYDYLRVLMARVGQIECFRCGAAIRQQSPEQIVESIGRLPAGTKAMILAPLVRGRKGKHDDALAAIRKAGFVRVRIDGQVHDVENPPAIDPRRNHDIEAVVDRVVIRAQADARLAESVDLALKHGDGVLLVCYAEKRDSVDVWHDVVHNTRYACPQCGTSLAEVEPRTFSFNSPYGACPACDGLGARPQFEPELYLADDGRSLAKGLVLAWAGATAAETAARRAAVEPFLEKAGAAWETPLAEYSPKAREQLVTGDGKTFAGLTALLDQELATSERQATLDRFELFRIDKTCGECGGSRLRPESRSVRVGGKAIHEIAALTVDQARVFFAAMAWNEVEAPIAAPLVSEIEGRLRFLHKVGVEYLTLDRAADTLSGGELQRVRLATCIGSGLVGVCYVLDEPSIGLHPKDNDRLIAALRDLQQQGNTVVVVEHDEAIMRAADWLIDVGPGAGRHGGQIVASGAPREVAACATSITGDFLAGRKRIATRDVRRAPVKGRAIALDSATGNNLKNVSVQIPLGVFTCATGVSGSGKSTLFVDTLAPAIARRLGAAHGGDKAAYRQASPYTNLRGVNLIEKFILVDQAPIGRTPRSNPATYTGVFDEIRKVFATTREAKRRGYAASRFSFNTAGGRCDACHGQGQQKIEMSFLPDIFVPCNECRGARFNRPTLQVRYRDKSIADVLAMPADEAVGFFENFPIILRTVTSLVDVGLGYLPLGQASTALSGGEAQRVKLAAELARFEAGNTLYLFDEPTTGLHFVDIDRLLAVLQRLVDRGNSVIVIEHQQDVIRAADWVIELGPGGGADGGQIVYEGAPRL
jgi:excinuclease ABC subunit A